MNDTFEKKVRAAAVALWWVVLIAVAVIVLQWLAVSGRHQRSTGMGFVHVGAELRLGFRPDGLVLGHRRPEIYWCG